MPKQIVGICGRKGSGKSTLASLFPFAKNHPFAGPMKRGLEAMGFPSNLFTDPALKAKPNDLLQGKTPRHAMVTLGTEWGRRMIGPQLWVNLWEKEVSEETHSFIVVDDVRFAEEVLAIRALGGLLVAVKRPNEPEPPEWYEFWRKKWHLSESLRYEDYGIPVIMNDGTPQDLLEKFSAIKHDWA